VTSVRRVAIFLLYVASLALWVLIHAVAMDEFWGTISSLELAFLGFPSGYILLEAYSPNDGLLRKLLGVKGYMVEGESAEVVLEQVNNQMRRTHAYMALCVAPLFIVSQFFFNQDYSNYILWILIMYQVGLALVIKFSGTLTGRNVQ